MGIRYHTSGYGDPLLLPTTQKPASFADLSVIFLGKFLNELISVCVSASLLDEVAFRGVRKLIHLGVKYPMEYIVEDGITKKRWFLAAISLMEATFEDDSDLLNRRHVSSQPTDIEIADIRAVE